MLVKKFARVRVVAEPGRGADLLWRVQTRCVDRWEMVAWPLWKTALALVPIVGTIVRDGDELWQTQETYTNQSHAHRRAQELAKEIASATESAAEAKKAAKRQTKYY